MDEKRIIKWGGLLLLTAVLLLLTGYYLWTELQITGGVLGVPLDDAWIHFQFARNLSTGQGFSYNPGQPTPGSTAPLWTLVLAGIGLFRDDFMKPALALSTSFLLLSLSLAYGFTLWITRSIWAALLAGLGVVLSGRLLWAGLAGMETTAFAALSLAAIWAYSKWGLHWFAVLLFGLSSQLRPEGHALFFLALADASWTWWQSVEDSSSSRRLLSLARHYFPALVLYALIAAPYSLFSLVTTGRPLPNTFYAKVGSEHLFSWRTLRETVTWHWYDNPISLVLLLFGLAPLWRRSRLSVLWLISLPVFTAVIIDFTWHHGRYTMPLIPLQMVAAAVGAHWIVEIAAHGKIPFFATRFAKVLPFLIILLLGVGGIWRLPFWAQMLGNNTREIQEIDVALGEWLAENTPPESLVAVDDIGAITFLSGRRIVDMQGLVSPEVWPATNAAEGLERNQILTRILSQSQPDFMVGFPLWHWDIANNMAVAKPRHHVQTGSHTIIFQQDANVYETTWPYVEEAAPEYRVNATFGEGIELLGYDLDVGSALELILYWESKSVVDKNYDVFVHIMDESGEIVAQTDRKPLDGLVATDTWQPGDIIRDPLEVALPPDLPSGSYMLRLGIYFREDGERLTVHSGNSTADALLLEPVNVP